MTPTILVRQDLVYPDLSYKIVGVFFNVYDQLGYGLYEKTYQKAIAFGFKKIGLKYKEQVYVPVIFENKVIGKNYLDFIVEEKIVIELKRGNKFAKSHIDQLYNYLVAKNLKLGILVYFSSEKLCYKRVLNVNRKI